MALFELKNFKSHSGVSLSWKIDCDYLTDEDLDTLARVVSENYSGAEVIGIPTGGLRFAEKIRRYTGNVDHYDDETSCSILLVDDVMTTGKSFLEKRAEIMTKRNLSALTEFYGVVIFDRSQGHSNYLDWIIPIFKLDRLWINGRI